VKPALYSTSEPYAAFLADLSSGADRGAADFKHIVKKRGRLKGAPFLYKVKGSEEKPLELFSLLRSASRR